MFPSFPIQQTQQTQPAVDETQPAKAGGRKRRKGKQVLLEEGNFPQTWTHLEISALCEAWCAYSKDPIEGNGKKEQFFGRNSDKIPKYIGKEPVPELLSTNRQMARRF